MLRWFLPCILFGTFECVPLAAFALPANTLRQMVPVPDDVPRTLTKNHTPLSEPVASSEVVRAKLSRPAVVDDPPEKYFHESTFHPHYDGRFTNQTIPENNRHTALTYLVQTYLLAMTSVGVQTWLMHGSLLGWYWNRRVMPWDTDIDVQISLDGLESLATLHNMTIYTFEISKGPGMKAEADDEARPIGTRDYLLEVNPHYHNGSTADSLNMIDARWIDMDTGLFIDITALRLNTTAQALGLEGHLMCKDNHHYLAQDIFPLRSTLFENMPVNIPYAYSELLTEEYGLGSLATTSYLGHVFNSSSKEWQSYHPATLEHPQYFPIKLQPTLVGSQRIHI